MMGFQKRFCAAFLLFFSLRLFAVEMVFVQGGLFMMGSNEEKVSTPAHKITVSDFYIGKYEVTQKEWKEMMGNNPSYFFGDTLPVHNVSWFDAIEFCNKLSEKENLRPVYTIYKKKEEQVEGDNLQPVVLWEIAVDWSAPGYRLPTEAEWEFAARGGILTEGYRYSGSNNINEVAWYYSNSREKPHEVGTKKPNELELYDMSGNVYEWCWDRFKVNYYSTSVVRNPKGPYKGSYFILRSGSWFRLEKTCQVFYRRATYPYTKSFLIGFRVVRNK